MLLKIRRSRRVHSLSKDFYHPSKWFAWLVPILAIILWMGYKEIKSYFVQPQVIFVLGGEPLREQFAAKFARQHPNLPIWVSGGTPEGYAKKVFTKAGINWKRVHLDYQAVDTVTNFTTVVEQFQAKGINSVYLITSDDHMLRARIIGEVVFGSRGINIQPVSIATGRSPESVDKSLRDGARAILWLATGYTGATIARQLKQPKN
ncbi:MAG TPA: YdcF family protein [Oculatellaceae cyanobacterium]|jgi:uncharacterized SAM-binding protein YcdF (DUF218 family)